MRPFAATGGVVLMLMATACHRDAGRAFVEVGRGAIRDTSAVQVKSVAVADETTDFDGNQVSAGSGSTYVLLDCIISAPADQVDMTDFQLVQERASQIGTETNLGNSDDRNYFFWTYLDENGRRATTPAKSTAIAVRLAFKVPAVARTGYLFYWGLYWGPLTLPAAAPKPG